MKRIINLSVEVEDNDRAELRFYQWANDNIAPRYIRTLPNTSEFKDDKVDYQ
jgi:hypothetical protein